MANLLEIRNVTKVYQRGLLSSSAKVALRDFSLTLSEEDPTILTVAGESGSGKTTLAMLLLGFITPTTGEIISKSAAADYALATFGSRWQPLLAAALAYRQERRQSCSSALGDRGRRRRFVHPAAVMVAIDGHGREIEDAAQARRGGDVVRIGGERRVAPARRRRGDEQGVGPRQRGGDPGVRRIRSEHESLDALRPQRRRLVGRAHRAGGMNAHRLRRAAQERERRIAKPEDKKIHDSLLHGGSPFGARVVVRFKLRPIGQGGQPLRRQTRQGPDSHAAHQRRFMRQSHFSNRSKCLLI